MKSLGLVLCLFPSLLFAQNIAKVVPAANEKQLGNGGADAPFTLNPGGSARFQEVFSSSEFSSFGAPDLLLIGIEFRTDEQAGHGDVHKVIPDFQIDFSTTARAPDGLSSVFAENVGANNRAVVPRGPLSVNTGGFHGPDSFDFYVPLDSPFYYSPAQGNLLMDIRNYSGVQTTFFDMQGTTGDSISRVHSESLNSSAGVNAASGQTDTYGLVVKFIMQPVPEPGTAALLALGLGLIGVGYWTRKPRPRKEDQ